MLRRSVTPSDVSRTFSASNTNTELSEGRSWHFVTVCSEDTHGNTMKQSDCCVCVRDHFTIKCLINVSLC